MRIHYSLGLIVAFFDILSIGFSSEWVNFTNSNEISGSAIQDNYLWLGSSGGVVKWNLTDSTYVKYTTVNGLVDHWVKDVFVDGDGNVWFGTIEGVQKFDGVNWTTYNSSNSPLPDNRVYSICEDNLGNLWFGTGYGIAKFTGTEWTAYTDLGGGATDVAVRGIGVDSQNRIWTANNPNEYGDPGGISVFDGSIWTRHDPDPSSIGQYFLSIAVDGNDNIWAGSWTNWVFKWDGTSWTHFDGSNSELLGTQIEAIEVEADTILWFANHGYPPSPTNGGVTKFDGETWISYNPQNSGLAERQVYTITVDGSVKYFGTRSSGVSRYDDFVWKTYRTSNEPHCNWITSISVNSLNEIFFGTEYYGIAKFDGAIWSSYWSENSGLEDDYINYVYVDAGDTLWVGTQYSGLYKFDGITWINYNKDNSGLLGNIILSIVKDSYGNLWLGTEGWDGPQGQNGALCKWDGTEWTNYYLSNSGLIDDDGLMVAVDRGDTVWVGTEEGVSKFDWFGNSWTNYSSANSDLVEDHVQTIAIDSENTKWFGTRGGISRFNGSEWTNYTISDGLADNDIRKIVTTPGGAVWAATAGGVSVFEEKGWTSYTQSDGLADNDVSSAAIDHDGNLWFGTKRSGISCLIQIAPSVIVTAGPDTSGQAGDALTIEYLITNLGGISDRYSLTCNDSLGWEAELSIYSVTLDIGQDTLVIGQVIIPSEASAGEMNWIRLTAISQTNPSVRDSADLWILVTEGIVQFIRGDADSNMAVEMPDAVYILRYKFIPGSPPPSCMDTGDADDNGLVEMPDAVYILRYKFIPGSPPPPLPFPGCGVDPTEDELGCEEHPCMGR